MVTAVGITEFRVACVPRVSMGLGSKERPRNGIFGVLPAREMGREPKKRKRGVGEGKEGRKVKLQGPTLPENCL